MRNRNIWSQLATALRCGETSIIVLLIFVPLNSIAGQTGHGLDKILKIVDSVHLTSLPYFHDRENEAPYSTTRVEIETNSKPAFEGPPSTDAHEKAEAFFAVVTHRTRLYTVVKSTSEFSNAVSISRRTVRSSSIARILGLLSPDANALSENGFRRTRPLLDFP